MCKIFFKYILDKIDNILEMNKITAVVCSWNAIQSLEKCLESLIANKVKVIVVDADSNDGSRDIAIKYANQVLTDPRKGLAVARNIGIEKVETEYVLNWGADNILPKKQLNIMLDCLEQNNFAGVSAQTFIKSKKMNYLSKCLNLYKKARYYPGERNVIGTPSLFKTSLLKKNNFDNNMSWSDDADLCTRLAKKNYKFAISDAFVYENGYETLNSIFKRWKNYGKSDSEIFAKYSKEWALPRKLKSIFYPLLNEFFKPISKLSFLNKLKITPFLVFIMLVRYCYWIRYSIFR